LGSVVPVINVLYLPGDEKLRAVVETSLAFVTDVYRGEVLSGLRFVAFDADDVNDVRNATFTADIAGFTWLVERGKLRMKVEPRPPLFFIPHYNIAERCVWVPVSRHWSAPVVFSEVAHHITHHPVFHVPSEDKGALTSAFDADIGLEGLVRRHGGSAELALEIIMAINEVAVLYIISNYFVNLNREPAMTTIQANIRDFAIGRHHGLARRPRMSREDAVVLSEVFRRMSRRDLANVRRVVHEAFKKMIKKFPADVLESNRAKYEVLYRAMPPYH
jgi:hypothetical protein